jgi:PTS system glucitol/sorbitol-specific IIC component
VHPITGIFPHANAGELFVYLGIAAGITTLGLNTSDLAVRYLLVGMVVIMIRGVLTEIITTRMLSRRASSAEVSA